jgi:hypothetical protein
MEASGAREAYLQPSKLTPGELWGMLAALVLGGSLFLPWFSTSENRNSVIGEPGDLVIGPDDSATAWDTFPTLRWLLLAACIAPFVLSWIIARGHKLTWAPGEVTMIVGITSFVLILCNGIILGRPEPGVEISLSYGYFIALVASLGLAFCGYMRQAIYTEGKRPPGTF